MKFLIDADCPRKIGVFLKSKGFEYIDIRDIKPAAPDKILYEIIKKDSLILISRDTDFGNILRYPVKKNFGIILLRVHLLSIDEMIELLNDLFSRVSENDLYGSLTIINKNRYRIRRF